MEEDASEAVNVATDAAIKTAKKSTKRAIENVARGGAPAVADEREMDGEEASMVQSLTGDTTLAGPSTARGTGSTGTTGSYRKHWIYRKHWRHWKLKIVVFRTCVQWPRFSAHGKEQMHLPQEAWRQAVRI